jgi:Tfp pilus assembly protein PilV
MTLTRQLSRAPARAVAGLTLVEVVVALSVSLLAVSGIICGYLFSISSAQRSALYLAAGAKALERIEEIRSAQWDTSSWPPVDQLYGTNFPDQVVTLDEFGTGGGTVYATNYSQIWQISTNPPLKRVRVDCVWTFKGDQLITNTFETCRAPDQ